MNNKDVFLLDEENRSYYEELIFDVKDQERCKEMTNMDIFVLSFIKEDHVFASALHELLRIDRGLNEWMDNKIEKLDLKEGENYIKNDLYSFSKPEYILSYLSSLEICREEGSNIGCYLHDWLVLYKKEELNDLISNDFTNLSYYIFYSLLLGKIKDSREKNGKIYTYLMKDVNGLVKIGKSQNPMERHKQISGMNINTELLAICDKNIEKKLHDEFSVFRHRGEWFNLREDHIDYIIRTYNFEDLTKNR